jgi:hypothetical protein
MEIISLWTFRETQAFTIDNEMRGTLGLDSTNFLRRLLTTFSNALDRPRRVFCDQWLWIGHGAFERWKIRQVADVTQRDTHVAEKSATLDSPDRRIFEKHAELSVIQLQVFPQRHSGRYSTGRERRFMRNLSEPVPRTGIQTIVTTEDPIADKRTEFQRDGAF